MPVDDPFVHPLVCSLVEEVKIGLIDGLGRRDISPKSNLLGAFDRIAASIVSSLLAAQMHTSDEVRGGLVQWAVKRITADVLSQTSGESNVEMAAAKSWTESTSSIESTIWDDQAGWRRLARLVTESPCLWQRIIDDPPAGDDILSTERFQWTLDEASIHLRRVLTATTTDAAAAYCVRHFYLRRLILIAAADHFVSPRTPASIGREIADTASVTVDAALDNALSRWVAIRGLPLRPDGSSPQITVIGTGTTGGGEMGYNSPIRLVFLYDSMDHRNVHHSRFYQSLIDEVVEMIGGDPSRHDTGIDVDLRDAPRGDFGVKICSFFDAVQILENSGPLKQRLRFIKSRPVAGSLALGDSFVSRLNAWIYQDYLRRSDQGEAAALVNRIRRRMDEQGDGELDVLRCPGGLHNIMQAVGILQLMHGRSLPTVRGATTLDAIAAMGASGVIPSDDASKLSENYSRLLRLQNQVWVTLGKPVPTISSEDEYQRLASALIAGVTDPVASGKAFRNAVDQTLRVNSVIICRLLGDKQDVDASDSGTANVSATGDVNSSDEIEYGPTSPEAELILDPDPDLKLVDKVLRRRGFEDPPKILSQLQSLSRESVQFLSSNRCRHSFAAILNHLLDLIASSPNPQQTLERLVDVTDSLGAKATLWELLGRSLPTMQLFVRMAASAPFLTKILTDNPGMIDELIDSLLIDRLPSDAKIDAQSIEVCRGASDIDLILDGFRGSSHLTIGVRDLLNKEPIESTHAAIADVAAACIRRVVEMQYQSLSAIYGDPVDEHEKPIEPIIVAMSSLGQRQPNYRSQFEIALVYRQDGQTRRRIGGPRSTTSHGHFFSELLIRTVQFLNESPTRRIMNVSACSLGDPDSGISAIPLDRLKTIDLSKRSPIKQLSLTAARAISGPLQDRETFSVGLDKIVAEISVDNDFLASLRRWRDQSTSTTHESNFRRGVGGSLDVETIAACQIAMHSSKLDERPTGTIAILSALSAAGLMDRDDANELIAAYRTLRTLESDLQLLECAMPHDLSDDDDPIWSDLAFLTGSTAEEMRDRIGRARATIRSQFDRLIPDQI